MKGRETGHIIKEDPVGFQSTGCYANNIYESFSDVVQLKFVVEDNCLTL